MTYKNVEDQQEQLAMETFLDREVRPAELYNSGQNEDHKDPLRNEIRSVFFTKKCIRIALHTREIICNCMSKFKTNPLSVCLFFGALLKNIFQCVSKK